MNFVTMAKPVGALCNMQCSYCYYLKADSNTQPSQLTMTDDVLEKYIQSYISACDGDTVSFTWHGGEPTLAGISFFEKVVAIQKKHLPNNKHCWNNIQTNGLCIDDTWASFLKKNHFDVGVSLDGTRFIHDSYRIRTDHADTYERVLQSVEILKRHGIDPDLLCTVTSDTAESPKAVYQALRKLNTGWIQFIPIVRRDHTGAVTADSVSPKQYGRFLKEIFKEWIRHDLGKINVQIFAETALVLSGKPSNVCWFAETCGNVIVVEKDGSVYACDHYVDEKHYLGNLCDTDLGSLAESDAQKEFGNRKHTALSEKCRQCQYEYICHGCCPKDRFSLNEDGEYQYYLCEGLQMYFDTAVPLLQKAMAYSAEGKTPAQIMKLL